MPSDQTAGDRSRGGAGDLRRLKAIGLVLPIGFVLILELVRFRVVERDVIGYHQTVHYGSYIALAAFTIAAVMAFSFVMFHFIERSQNETAELVANLRRRQQEGHGFYDVLLRISNQNELADILAAVAGHARDLLASDDAVVCLNDATTRSVQFDLNVPGTAAFRDGVCISPDADGPHGLHDHRIDCPVGSSPNFTESLRSPIQSRDRKLGDLSIGRKSAIPFSERDRQFLSTLSDLASIAVTSAGMRESERQSAILAERERIAREMHDSLAQVLGVTHLRLRALGAREDVWSTPTTAIELAELADICEEAYHDVREAILDLREASRTDRGLLDGLRAYLDKYTHQSGISTSLETTPDRDLVLPPNSEIQIIRVIQESLTNVRKHSGASSAVVRITETDGTAKFVVEDDGRGFELAGTPLERDSFGLHSMR
ncbi:MAG: GAF domain-containing protein, partial [Thermoleophilia bacterium]|nr:GAF domain-containing protein [Thermoleophilia bacterium]